MTSVSECGRETMALGLELGAQLAVVVDLAVEEDGDATVLVENRLMAAGQIDDRKAPHAERHAIRRRGSPRRPGRDGPSHRTCARVSSRARRRPRHATMPAMPHISRRSPAMPDLALVNGPGVLALVQCAGVVGTLGRVGRDPRARAACRRPSIPARIDEEADRLVEDLRVRPNSGRDERLAARELLVDLEWRVGAVQPRRNQYVRRTACSAALVSWQHAGQQARVRETQARHEPPGWPHLRIGPADEQKRASGRLATTMRERVHRECRFPGKPRTFPHTESRGCAGSN